MIVTNIALIEISIEVLATSVRQFPMMVVVAMSIVASDKLAHFGVVQEYLRGFPKFLAD